MAVYKILRYPHVLLRKKSSPVEKFTTDLKTFVSSMIETMRAFNGIGLAAPQVGIPKRILIVDVEPYFSDESLKDWHGTVKITTDGQESALAFPMILVNPVIARHEGEVNFPYDGCLSFPGVDAGVTSRHRFIELHAKDAEERDIKIECDGIMSICLQHEIDHLEGVLYVDRVQDKRTEKEVVSQIADFDQDAKERKRLKKLKAIDARVEKFTFL